jgi:hypothetical protein
MSGAAQTLSFGPGLERLIATSPALSDRLQRIQGGVRFTVTPRTVSGERIQEARGRLHPARLGSFRPHPRAQDEACQSLQRLGVEVLHVGRFAISARAPVQVVQELVGQRMGVAVRRRRAHVRSTLQFGAAVAPSPTDLFVAPVDSLSVRCRQDPAIDHFVFTPPPLSFADPLATPPTPAYHHFAAAKLREWLRVPSDASGTGIPVAIVDTGFFPHPFYSANQIDIQRIDTPGSGPATVDEVGHGTAVPWNVLAVAPKASLLGVKQSNPPEAALEIAVQHGARVVSCSWGWDYEQSFPVLEATIGSIIHDDNVTVVCASGNGQYAWPGSMPDVISVGGVYVGPNGLLEASDYASGFLSSHYPGRRVPDVSGLCGPAPLGIYLPMPCSPGGEMDQELGAAEYPYGDGTGPGDGWVVASGTSSAAPQVAGVVALILERADAKGRKLAPQEIKDILQRSAVPVSEGRNAFGFPASKDVPNLACGYGLVDTTAAIALVCALV